MPTTTRNKVGWILVFSGVSMLGCDQFFYYPCVTRYDDPMRLRATYEDVHFLSRNGTRLHGWFFPPKGEAVGTVLHLHGNAGNITGHFQHAVWLTDYGFNVLCFDYGGYGQSEGQVSRAGTIEDAHGALDYLLARVNPDGDRIVAFGQSLGGAVGVVLAAERPEIRALVTDGAFDSYRAMASWHLQQKPLLQIVGAWVPLALSDDYNPIDYIARIAPRPVMIMHGTDDRVVDPRMAGRLYDAAREPKSLWLVEGADHYGAMQDRADEAHQRITSLFIDAMK